MVALRGREGTARHVVVHAERVAVERCLRVHVVERGLHVAGRELLAAEAVAGGEHRGALELRRARAARAVHRAEHVEVERLALAAALLRAVEDGDRAHGRRQRGDERGGVERTVQPHRDDAHLLARLQERVHGLAHGLGSGAHHHDHALGVRRAVVVEEVVGAAGELGEAVHRALHDAGEHVVEAVRRLASLEVDVRVLHGAADDRVLGGEPAFALLGHEAVVDHRTDGRVVHLVDLLHLVGGAEPVEEMHERHA